MSTGEIADSRCEKGIHFEQLKFKYLLRFAQDDPDWERRQAATGYYLAGASPPIIRNVSSMVE